ncbi:hypothetical protein JX265_011744 [Neoarthrinium moseri]|uniref:Uncharacterized protein n=1 Tax=Neoarthrinium moseri TaxID=1658444 RepID=A0A9P9WBR1_9PEZI|nr:uncharacterized protein JN550_002046 [Neoarthrinium moseri]KAI1856232.1 hypothetical protein JX265_011744 [Neoarthrinium moseri]KAI1875760.1 hypothetical protein JN550_002046 [Neoarthrinium moseri]
MVAAGQEAGLTKNLKLLVLEGEPDALQLSETTNTLWSRYEDPPKACDVVIQDFIGIPTRLAAKILQRVHQKLPASVQCAIRDVYDSLPRGDVRVAGSSIRGGLPDALCDVLGRDSELRKKVIAIRSVCETAREAAVQAWEDAAGIGGRRRARQLKLRLGAWLF